MPNWVRSHRSYRKRLSDDSKDGWEPIGPENLAYPGTANIISSVLCEIDGETYHRPMIDLDLKHFYSPSSTNGHAHLYLDTVLTHDQYKELIHVLYKCGIVSDGIKKQIDHDGATTLRLPGLSKHMDVEEDEGSGSGSVYVTSYNNGDSKLVMTEEYVKDQFGKDVVDKWDVGIPAFDNEGKLIGIYSGYSSTTETHHFLKMAKFSGVMPEIKFVDPPMEPMSSPWKSVTSPEDTITVKPHSTDESFGDGLWIADSKPEPIFGELTSALSKMYDTDPGTFRWKKFALSDCFHIYWVPVHGNIRKHIGSFNPTTNIFVKKENENGDDASLYRLLAGDLHGYGPQPFPGFHGA